MRTLSPAPLPPADLDLALPPVRSWAKKEIQTPSGDLDFAYLLAKRK